MARVKRGFRQIAVIKSIGSCKGYYGARSRVFRVAVQAVTKAGQYAYRDRRNKNVHSVVYGLHVSTRF